MPPRSTLPPRVSVLVAAFNEVGCIAAKLRSTLEQRYPADRLEVIVISDGSDDGTDAVVAAWPDRRVVLARQEPRAGKASALNRGVGLARGDVLVFTDANAMFAPDAIARLVAPFDDPRVGLVSGQGLYAGRDTTTRAVASGYVRYEAALKAGEARLGFLAAADGAIYALRRSLYRDLAPAEANDLLHPIQAALAGYVSRFEPEAVTLEPPSEGGTVEFQRHVRIIAQGIQLLRVWLPALIRARRWTAVGLLASHRILRWATGPCLLAALAVNLALVGVSPLYGLTLGLQGLFYGLAGGGLAGERRGRSLGKLAIPYYFCLVSAAGAAGLVRSLRGRADAVWRPTGGAPVAERAA